MVKTTGPAVGSKGQVGFKEETKWGYPALPPTSFIEFTGEGIVSEYTNLVSGALRADRAVHKQRIGSESAGGDINFELCPEGFGTLLKHALGKKRTKRKDVAFIMVYEGTATDMIVSVTAAGVFATGSSDSFAIYFGATETVQNVMTAIDAETNWSCYAPWGDGTTGYFGVDTKSGATKTLGTGDYDSSAYALIGGVCNLEIITDIYCDEDKGESDLIFFPINFKYGIYEHTLDADADLPQGLSFEIGRDVAAFNYYGGRVNSLALTINPGELLTGTVNVMCKGASTCGDPVADSSNTGWKIPFCGISYAGSEDSAKISVGSDGTKENFYFEHGDAASEVPTYGFSLERGYYSHDGYYWEVTTMNGLLEFLEYESDYFSVTRKGGISGTDLTTGLDGQTLVAMSADTDTVLYKDTDAAACPLIRGNYIGTDSGTSVLITVKVSTGGAMDGTAEFQSMKTGDSGWCTAQTITADTWHNLLDADDIDTGFDIMFPDSVTLVQDDQWTITSFKDEASNASYSTLDILTGFQGAVTFDKDDGEGLSAQGVLGASVSLNNNLYGDKFELGDRQRAALVPQRRTTEGSMNLEFDDLDLYRMFVNGSSGDILITATSDEYINSSSTNYSVSFRMPELKFSGTTPVAGGEEIITTEFPFNSLYDDTEEIPDLRIIITNHQSYV